MRILFIQLLVDDKKYIIIAGIGEKMWKTHLSSGKLKSPQNLHKNFCPNIITDGSRFVKCYSPIQLKF